MEERRQAVGRRLAAARFRRCRAGLARLPALVRSLARVSLCLALCLALPPAGAQHSNAYRAIGVAGESLDIAFEHRLQYKLTEAGSVTLLPHWLLGGQFQFDDPEQPNYAQMASAAGRMAGRWQLRDAYHGGERAPAQALVFTPAETLMPGDLMRISLAGITLPPYVVDQLELLVEIDGGEGGQPSTLPIIIATGPGDFSQARVFAPPVVSVSRPFAISIRAEDRLGNLAAPSFPRTFDLYLDGTFETRVAVAETLTSVNDLLVFTPGLHRIELAPAAGGAARVASAVLAVAGEAPQVEWLSLREPINAPHGVRSLALARQESAGRFSHFLPTGEPVPGWHEVGQGLEAQESRPRVSAGGSRFRVRGQGQEIEILLAELPSAMSHLTPRTPLLAEIAAGRSIYEWQGIRAADRGHALAFVASAHSHARSPLNWRTATAVIREGDESLMAALARGSAYASYDERILVLASQSSRVAPPPPAEATGDAAAQPAGPGQDDAAGQGRANGQGAAADRRAGAGQDDGAGQGDANGQGDDRAQVAADSRSNRQGRRPGHDRSDAASETAGAGGASGAPAGSPPEAEAAPKVVSIRRKPGSPPLMTRLKAEIVAETGVTQVELLKNGQLIRTFIFAEPEGGWLELRLFSDSKPAADRRSLPRNAREWLGYLSTNQGTLALRRPQPRVRLSADRRRIDFLLSTHGNAASLRFRLLPQDENSLLTLSLAAGIEDAAWLPADRPPSEIPAWRLQFPLAELLAAEADAEGDAQSGVASRQLLRSIAVAGYEDTVALGPAYPASSNYVALDYEDAETSREGDYYHFRVQTAGGGMAWSSPLYVQCAEGCVPCAQGCTEPGQ